MEDADALIRGGRHPHRTGVEEDSEVVEAVFDRLVEHALAASGREVMLVPAAQHD